MFNYLVGSCPFSCLLDSLIDWGLDIPKPNILTGCKVIFGIVLEYNANLLP
jgi:hypothetical protein